MIWYEFQRPAHVEEDLREEGYRRFLAQPFERGIVKRLRPEADAVDARLCQKRKFFGAQ